MTFLRCSSEKEELLLKVRQEHESGEQKLRELEFVKSNDSKKLYEQLRRDRETALQELEDRLQAERQRAIARLEQKHAEEMNVSVFLPVVLFC